MKFYLTKRKKRKGYISFEIIIVAACIMVFGLFAVSRFVFQGQQTTDSSQSAYTKTYETAMSTNPGYVRPSDPGPQGGSVLPDIPGGGSIVDKEIVIFEGDGQTFFTATPTDLTFKSNAEFSDFEEVQINGETVDPAYYTVVEGSTIVTIDRNYLETLSVDSYEITIVSETGTPSAQFTVKEPEKNSDGFYYNQPYMANTSSVLGHDTAFFIRENNIAGLIILPSGSVVSATYSISGNTIYLTTNSLGTLTGNFSSDGDKIVCPELGITAILGDDSIAADENYVYIFNSSLGGYAVFPIDNTQSSYHEIKTGINGKPTILFNDFAFQNCDNISEFTVLSHIKTIGEWAFSYCDSLETLIIDDGVQIINEYAFAYSNKLKEISIPSSVETLNATAFIGCDSLTDVYYEGTAEDWERIYFDNVAGDFDFTIHFNSTGSSN